MRSTLLAGVWLNSVFGAWREGNVAGAVTAHGDSRNWVGGARMEVSGMILFDEAIYGDSSG
jgi:hypothetical protein